MRFRLGGSCFPPLLFYKIFTHRPVADIGTFCPRNYSAEAAVSAAALFNKPPPPAQAAPARQTQAYAPLRPAAPRHVEFESDFDIPEAYRRYVRPDGTIGLRSTVGWYRRHENNGWRPVNEVKMVDGEDELSRAKRSRPVFHYNPAARRQERARQRKLRRRAWMVALYRCAMRSSGSKTGMTLPGQQTWQNSCVRAVEVSLGACSALCPATACAVLGTHLIADCAGRTFRQLKQKREPGASRRSFWTAPQRKRCCSGVQGWTLTSIARLGQPLQPRLVARRLCPSMRLRACHLYRRMERLVRQWCRRWPRSSTQRKLAQSGPDPQVFWLMLDRIRQHGGLQRRLLLPVHPATKTVHKRSACK